MWMKYEGRTQLPLIPDDHVTISRRGSIGIAVNLGRPEMERAFCEVEYDPETKRIRLTLCPQATSRTYTFRGDPGHYRIEPKGALKLWGILPLPAGPLMCSAEWIDGALVIQLPATPVNEIEPPVVEEDSQEPPLPPPSPKVKQKCICARCGEKFVLVQHREGNRPYSHKLKGKPCPGVFQSPLPIDGEQ